MNWHTYTFEGYVALVFFTEDSAHTAVALQVCEETTVVAPNLFDAKRLALARINLLAKLEGADYVSPCLERAYCDGAFCDLEPATAYNVRALKQVTTPQIFDPPKRMIVWSYEQGTPVHVLDIPVIAVLPEIPGHASVMGLRYGRVWWSEYCAEIP